MACVTSSSRDLPFIVFGNASTAAYPEGGGHWSVRIQYMRALTQMGVSWRWLELLRSSGNRQSDEKKAHTFLRRLHWYGVGDKIAVAIIPKNATDLDQAQFRGAREAEVKRWIAEADILWNFCCAIREPLLSRFKKRALLDLDPGHIQAAAMTVDMEIDHHEVHFTVGSKLADADTLSPDLGLTWHPFWPVLHLPMWKVTADPGPSAPFSSVTQWNWGGELPWKGGLLSTSKRDAYLRYLSFPKLSRHRLDLAANIHPHDTTGDREMLAENGWRLVHPHVVGHNPALYRRYIQSCRAEFSCPKPVFRELRTGWFSDRSAAFLASGRPVLAEDTGFSDHIPTGHGLVKFSNMDEALAGIEDITAHYASHARAARALAQEYFDATKVLGAMIERC